MNKYIKVKIDGEIDKHTFANNESWNFFVSSNREISFPILRMSCEPTTLRNLTD